LGSPQRPPALAGEFESDYFLCADDGRSGREQCLAVKADLVTIDSEAEDDFLTRRTLESAFIDATDEVLEGDWLEQMGGAGSRSRGETMRIL
jgi:hypothetical protein